MKTWERLSSASLAKLFPKPSTTLSLWQQERWAIWRLVIVCCLLLWSCQDLYSKDWKTIRFVDLVQLFSRTWSWWRFRRLECCLRCCLLRLNRKDSVTRAVSSTESSNSSWSRAETSPEETALEVNAKQCHLCVKRMRWVRCQDPRKYNLKLQRKSMNGTKLLFFSEWRQEHLWRPFPWRELQAEALRPRLAQHGQCRQRHKRLPVLHHHSPDAVVGRQTRSLRESFGRHGGYQKEIFTLPNLGFLFFVLFFLLMNPFLWNLLFLC